jgi:putative membrane protein
VNQELWFLGVPFFDSLSFSFLLAASYGLAWFLLTGEQANSRGGGGPSGTDDAWSRPRRVGHLLTTVCLFVLADVVIDPVALRGDRWFLGRIYGYPQPGIYFGVPLANFLGWGVVGVVATGLYHAWERRLPAASPGGFRGRAALCPALYFVVLGFNLGVAFAIREWWLGLTGVALVLPIAIWTLAILAGMRPDAWRPRGEGIHV